MKKGNILIVNSDLLSNGGIASVIKTYYGVYEKGNFNFKLFLLRTNYYKDKSLLYEFVILVTSLFSYFNYLLLKNVKVVHIHSSANVSFFRKSIFVIIGKCLNKTILFHIHASNFYDFFLSKNKLLRFFIRIVLSNCDEVIVLCNDWAEKLKNNYPKIKIVVIANPINIEENRKVKSKIKSDVFNILFVGFLIESKGIRDLMHFAKKIKDNNIEKIKLSIAGKGDLEKYVIEFIEREHLENIVEYVGWKSGYSKDDLYLNSDLFVLPSYKEGMPISILEAMSFGLPVISTQIAGIPELIEENINGYLITPGDIDKLFEKTVYLRNNNKICEEMEFQNLKKVVEFSAKNIFKKVAEKYDEYLNEK